MRAALALVAVLGLVGCRPLAATPTLDPATPAGFRQATAARGAQLRRAVEALHAGCGKGVAASCTPALAKGAAAIAAVDGPLRATPAPPGCAALAGGSRGLVRNAQGYGEALRAALAAGDPAGVAAADAQRWQAWQVGWANHIALGLRTDACK